MDTQNPNLANPRESDLSFVISCILTYTIVSEPCVAFYAMRS